MRAINAGMTCRDVMDMPPAMNSGVRTVKPLRAGRSNEVVPLLLGMLLVNPYDIVNGMDAAYVFGFRVNRGEQGIDPIAIR